LKNFEEDTREITYVFKRVRALSKRMDEVDDQIEKYAHNIQRLLKTSRNTEKALLTNGLLLEGDYLSRSSSSELD
jgi:predicted  nucleic acid-binding Zn-ribbon protein